MLACVEDVCKLRIRPISFFLPSRVRVVSRVPNIGGPDSTLRLGAGSACEPALPEQLEKNLENAGLAKVTQTFFTG